MADTPQNASDKDDGGVVVPTVAGVGGAYVGGLAASHVMHGDAQVQKKLLEAEQKLETATGKRDAALNKAIGKLKAGSPERKLYDNHVANEANYNSLKSTHAAQTQGAWNTEIPQLKGPAQGELEIKGLEGQIKYLEETAPQGSGKFNAIKSLKAQVKAVEDKLKEPGFTGRGAAGATVTPLDPAHARAELDTAMNAARSANPMPAAITSEHELNATLESGIKEARHKALLAGADSETVGKITNATGATAADLEVAAAKHKGTKAAWEATEKDLIGKEVKEHAHWKGKVDGYKAIGKLNAEEKGFVKALKRPFVLLEEGGMGTKLGILVPAVALCAVTYNLTKGARASKSDASFTDRVDQQRLVVDQTTVRGA